MAGMGVYVGNDPSSVTAFESWAGRPVDFLAAHTGQASWSDWTSSIGWLADQFKNETATLTWSIPMFADGGSLAQGATGAYDSHYLDAARTLAAKYAGEDKIYVRTGEEFNGTWMTWAAAGKEQDFIATYRHFVDAFRSVSDKFVFEWNVNVGDYGMNPANAYPGDAYVDIIGMDFYYDTKWDNTDPLKAWDTMVNRTYGLAWFEAFAAQHGKPTAYSEWGVNSDTAGPYIQKAHEWFEAHNVLYQQYWNSDEAFAGELTDGKYSHAASAYIAAFGEVIDNSLLIGDELANNLVASVEGSVLQGMGGNDSLVGTAGADSLDGGAGADRMTGGAGSDTYIVDNTGDVVVEYSSGGYDTIKASVSYTLSSQVEALELTGTASLSGTGNEMNNTITGNAGANLLKGLAGDDTLIGGAGNDTLDGGIGADIMKGGTGNDTYLVSQSNDQVIELAGEGTDTVQSGVSHTLGVNVENLLLLWSGNSTGVGNDLNNTITGNDGANLLKGMAGDDVINGGAGNDIIDGGVGFDTLTGGAGADTFVFSSLSGSTNAKPDLIMDLTSEDKIDLHSLDADTKTTGDQAFHLVSAFTGAVGELKVTYDSSIGKTVVAMDVNGDGYADSTIKIVGDHVDFSGWLF